MIGTYFFQLELFEDETAAKVSVPRGEMGPRHDVHFGRTVEGILGKGGGITAAEVARQY